MRTHGALTEDSVSYHPVTPDRKGREGKGREVGHPSINLTTARDDKRMARQAARFGGVS